MTDDHRRHGANLQTKPHQQLDSPQSRPDPEVVCDAKKRKHKNIPPCDAIMPSEDGPQ